MRKPNPFCFYDALELEGKWRRMCISMRPSCISNTERMNRFVLHKWEKDCHSSASIPAFALPYLKIFYSSCSGLLYSVSICNSNPQIFLGLQRRIVRLQKTNFLANWKFCRECSTWLWNKACHSVQTVKKKSSSSPHSWFAIQHRSVLLEIKWTLLSSFASCAFRNHPWKNIPEEETCVITWYWALEWNDI